MLHELKSRVQGPGAAEKVGWHFLPVGLEKRVHRVDRQFLKVHCNERCQDVIFEVVWRSGDDDSLVLGIRILFEIF